MGKLITFAQAAELLGVPAGSLRVAAETHGFLIRVGSAVRLNPDDFPALIEACKVPARKVEAPQLRPLPPPSSEPFVVRFTKAALEFDERQPPKRKPAARRKPPDVPSK